MTERVTMEIGSSEYVYDQAVYDEVMAMKADEILAELVRRLEEFDNEPGERTRYRMMRKAQRAAVLAWWRTNEHVEVEAYEAEQEDGDHRDGCECDDCEEFYADEHDGPVVGAAPDGLGQRDLNEGIDEWHAFMDKEFDSADTDVDPEFAAEVDALVVADLTPETTRILRDAVAPLVLPITETDVQATARVDVVVQLRNRLYNGKLIAVVNRRTRFAQPVLATVEVGGHRFLVNADDMLAA